MWRPTPEKVIDMERKMLSLIIAIISVILLSSMVVRALPSGVENLQIIDSERRNESLYPAPSIEVIAGNVTELNITGETITRHWAGLFGEVTGKITLEDANGNIFYDWTVANPQGEIYAARVNSVDWTSIRCANSTERSNEDAVVSANPDNDEDAPSRTFLTYGTNDGYTTTNGHVGPGHPTFWVGSVQIDQNTCYSAAMYNSSRLEGEFWEVMLSDGSNVVYAATLANSDSQDNGADGFDGTNHDFEMIVPENGTGTDVATTTYYLWIELS